MQTREVPVLRKQNQAEFVVFPAAILTPDAVHLTVTLFLVLKLNKTVYLFHSDKFWDIIIEVFCYKHVTDQGSISQTGSFVTHYFSRKLLL